MTFFQIPGHPCAKRCQGMKSYNPINGGGTYEEEKEAWVSTGCGTNVAMVVEELMKDLKKDAKRVVGFEKFQAEWPACFTFLTSDRGSAAALKTEFKEKCNWVIKMMQPTKKFNRETRTFGVPTKKSTWTTPKYLGVSSFWCPKTESTCKDFFNTGSGSIYMTPSPSLTRPDHVRNPPAPPPAALPAALHDAVPEVVEEPNEINENENDENNAANNDEDGEEDDDQHGADEEGRDVDVVVNVDGVVVVEENVGGYILVVPTVEKARLLNDAAQKYIDEHKDRIGIGLPVATAREVVKQRYVQDQSIYKRTLVTLKTEIESMEEEEEEEDLTLQELLEKKNETEKNKSTVQINEGSRWHNSGSERSHVLVGKRQRKYSL